MTAETAAPLRVTPALLAEHKLTAEEYERIVAALGREPNLVELGIFSALWSEHCSYKSSKVFLKELPTKGPRVLQGPGENAGAVDVGGGLAVVFKMESHNHPSFIEPYQGAATGVGGILRDVFTMGARPVALLDPLFFGRPEAPRMHALVDGVVRGVGGYGNCIGVPTVGGQTFFHPSYDKNILVNVMAVGLVRHDRIFRAKAAGVGNPVLYVGSKTGRDGIHGASMASDTFDDEKSKRRPTVQVGDPFTEKLLLEAVLEVLEGDAVVAIQDMGAAGLTSSSFEMCARGGVGMRLDLSKVPMRETGMTPYELMLSESQERMLLVAAKGREREVASVFETWGLDVAVVGEVTARERMELLFDGAVVADLPIAPLVDEAPVYRRPFVLPAPRTGDVAVPASRETPEALAAAFRALVSSPNLCGKGWITAQYDHTVRANTAIGPGGDAAVLRVKAADVPGGFPEPRAAEPGLAMTADVNPRYVAADPELGAAHAVAESALNLACVGARPLAVTDCLNFGSPERPEILGQLAAAVTGLGAACRALETPVISGNVSLYNETDGAAILPTPTVGMVGLLADVTKSVRHTFARAGDAVVLLGTLTGALGASEYAATVLGRDGAEGGTCPALDLARVKAMVDLLVELAERRLLSSAHDVSSGGLAVALAECLSPERRLGADVDVAAAVRREPISPAELLFGESAPLVVVSSAPGAAFAIREAAGRLRVPFGAIGRVNAEGSLHVGDGGRVLLGVAGDEVSRLRTEAFPRLMASPS